MRRRICIAGLVALGSVAVVTRAPGYSWLASSANSVQRYVENLNRGGNSLSPLERAVFGLLLADSKTAEPAARRTAPERRS